MSTERAQFVLETVRKRTALHAGSYVITDGCTHLTVDSYPVPDHDNPRRVAYDYWLQVAPHWNPYLNVRITARTPETLVKRLNEYADSLENDSYVVLSRAGSV